MATLMFERNENGADLSRLNDAERRVLLMLAEGHTAKSAANAIGSTPAAVNERLREARRKTGVGSSRELARLLKSQENCHDLMGVANAEGTQPNPSESGAELRGRQRRAVAMVGIFALIASGAVALMTDTAPPASNEIDPLLGQALPKSMDPADLHRKVRAEARDQQWAATMEKLIRDRVLKIPLIGKDSNTLRVICASTLCEIGGSVVTPASEAEREDPNSQFSRTIKDLQVPPLTDDLGKAGLKNEAGLFTSGQGKPDRSVFLLYYSRKK